MSVCERLPAKTRPGVVESPSAGFVQFNGRMEYTVFDYSAPPLESFAGPESPGLEPPRAAAEDTAFPNARPLPASQGPPSVPAPASPKDRTDPAVRVRLGRKRGQLQDWLMDHVRDGAVSMEAFLTGLGAVVGTDLPWRDLLPELGLNPGAPCVTLPQYLGVLQIAVQRRCPLGTTE